MAAITTIKPRGIDTTGNYVVTGLSATGNVSAGNIKTDHLLYANGSAYTFTANPSGQNTQIQFNDASSFAGSANLTFDKTTNTLTVTNIVSNGSGLTSLTGANVTGFVPNANIANTAFAVAGANVSGEVSFAATANAVAGANVSGFVPNANIANTAYAVAGANVSGEVSFAATANSVAGANVSGAVGLATYATTANAVAGANVSGAVAYATTANAVAGSNVSGEVSFAATANAVAGANVSGQVGNALIAGTVYTNAQPNITSVGTLTGLTVGNATANTIFGNGTITATGDISGANLTLSGNLVVSGTTTSVNSTVTRVVDPIFELGGGANGAALSTNDNKDRGTLLHYYTTAPVDAFMGWDSSNSEFAFGSNVTVASEVTTFNSFGNVRANFFIGNGSQLTGIAAVTAVSLINGNSNVVVAANSNVTVSVTGTPNVVTITSTGINIAGYANLGSGNLTTTGNVLAGYIIGNGSSLTSLTGANVSGQVGNALVAGTVYTNAQPNITSVGTLSSLAVTGNISGANVSITGTTASTSKTTGALTVAGGVGISNDLTVGNSITVDNGSYGNVVITQFASIFATGSGPNPRAIYQATAADGVAGIGIQAYSGLNGQIYSNTGFTFTTGATVRDKDFPTGGTTRATIDSNGLAVTGNITSTNANLGNAVTANYFVGSGNNLSNLTFGNITAFNTAGLTIDELYLQSTTRLNVTASGSSGYIFDQYGVTVNPVLYVTSGQTLAFNLDVTGHPFLIQTSGSANYSVGLEHVDTTGTVSTTTSAQGKIAGTLYWKVPYGITGNYKYQCSIHGGMAGNIVVTDANVANIQVANATIASTVYTNAQPNITSVGTLSSLAVTGNITSGNANLGNAVTANYFVGSGIYVTGVAAATAATVTTNAQPNITSVGTLANLIVGNATANTTFGNGTITATGNISFTGANVSLGDVSNLKITGGTAGYFVTTDGAGNLSWGAAAGGGGVSATGSNTQLQFNDGGVLGASANLVFDKTTNTFTTGRVVASAGANLGTSVSNVYIGGGGASQILSTDGSGNLTWIAQPTAVITVDNFTGDGTTTTFTLSTTPSSINQTVINYNGAFQLRSAYTLTGPNITFSEAPANGSLIEVTSTMGATSGAGAFVTRTYTGNGVATTYTVTSGVTVSSVLVTENGLVQTPTVDYTISGSTLTFIVAPANGITIQIRELAISIATTNAPVYRAYTGNGVANTFTITSGLSANSLIVAENGLLQRPTTDYSVSGSNVVFVNAPASNVDIQIRELSLNGGGTSSGISLPTQGGNSGKYLTTDGATASWANVGGSLTIKEEGSNLTTAVTSIDFVGAGVTATNTGNAVTVTIPSGSSLGKTVALNMFLGI